MPSTTADAARTEGPCATESRANPTAVRVKAGTALASLPRESMIGPEAGDARRSAPADSPTTRPTLEAERFSPSPISGSRSRRPVRAALNRIGPDAIRSSVETSMPLARLGERGTAVGASDGGIDPASARSARARAAGMAKFASFETRSHR